MQIARDLAGYSLGAADLLRRAMGKKIKAEMDQQRDIFVAGAVARGLAESLASTIFDQVAKFASYGFNKSHAAAYALLAYQTAYVKAKHPLAFFAAAMTMDRGNHTRLANAREEMLKKGIELLRPDVNRSEVLFAIERRAAGDDAGAIRFALAAIKGVGEQAMAALVAERQASGPFDDIFDLVARVGPKVLNRRLLEGLVRAGALDGFGAPRAAQLAAIDAALRYGQAVVEAREGNQVGLFDGLGADVAIPKPPLPDLAEAAMLDVLAQEHAALGFFLSAHPLDGYRVALGRAGAVPVAGLAAQIALADGPRILKVAGIAVDRQERTSARGRFAFVTLSDPSGQIEVTVYADVLARCRDLLDATDPVLVHVDGRLDGEDVRLIARDIEPLDDALGDHRALVEIELADGITFERLLPYLAEEMSGAARVRVSVPGERADERVVIQLPDTAMLALARRPDVAALGGVVAVRDLG